MPRASYARLTIKRSDAGQILLPAHVLTVDVAKIGDEKGILLAGVALLMVDGLDAVDEGLANELLGNGGTVGGLDGGQGQPFG